MGICSWIQKKKDISETKRVIKESKEKEILTIYNSLPWVVVAKGEIGQAEIVGKKHNPKILEYHQATSLRAGTDEVAWCASFMNWVLKECDISGTNSAAAQSFLKWGDALDSPKKGSICILKRGSKAWMGHVGLVTNFNDKYVWLLGGNQSNMVCVRKYSRDKELGYRWPQCQLSAQEPHGL